MEVQQKGSDTPANTIKYPINKIIQEGSAEIVSGGNVFYNPVQEFNRDLSISVLNVYFQRFVKEQQEKKLQNKDGTSKDEQSKDEPQKSYIAGEQYPDGMRILEALSATGLRSIRYAKEIAGVCEIVANDISNQAVESIRENVRHNKVEHLVTTNHANAMTLMYLSTESSKRFHAVDLDPYGCPNRFLDGAIQSIQDGGLLLVTATDMAVLAGSNPESCYVKYGVIPLRMKSCHEMALRILLHCIETHANRYGKYIEPLLSVSADFYVRVFVRVRSGQGKCKFSMSKQSMIFQCTGCDTYTLHPLGIIKPNPTKANPNQRKFCIPTGPPVGSHCEHCGHKFHLGGPIWSDAIHDKIFVKELLDAIQNEPLSNLGTQRRLIGVLSVILEELPDVALYYSLDKLCCVLKMAIMPMIRFRSSLLHAGYRVSFSHALKNSIKTDAPASVIWDILRCWSKVQPVNKKRFLDGTPLKAILSKEPEKQYDLFDKHPQADPASRKNALTRFQANPTSHWGPGTRATIMIDENKTAKNFRNQNKKQKRKIKAKPSTNDNDTQKSSEEDEQVRGKQAKSDD